MRLLVAFVLALLSLAPTASAAAPENLAGTWIWSVEGRNVFVVKLEAGRDGLAGTLERPAEIEMTMLDGVYAVTRIELPVDIHTLTPGGERDGGYLLHDSSANPGGVGDYLVRADGASSLVFQLDPANAGPQLTLHRPRPTDEVASDWQPGQMYRADRPAEPSNPELAAIFAADQADRKDGVNTEWEVVGPRDRAREARVREMLDEGLVASGEDYARAAFIFQHGEQPEDYLLAHALAMAAQAKGRFDAAWIGAASLDRYLSSIGKRTVFGTQFDNSGKSLQVADGLVTDAMRIAVGVPPLARQEEQMRQIEAGRVEQSGR